MSTLRIPVQPPPRPPLRVGVDVGGTKVAVLVAREDQELARKVNPTRLETPAQTLVGITDTIREAVALAGAEMGDVAAIGVGPGFKGEHETPGEPCFHDRETGADERADDGPLRRSGSGPDVGAKDLSIGARGKVE